MRSFVSPFCRYIFFVVAAQLTAGQLFAQKTALSGNGSQHAVNGSAQAPVPVVVPLGGNAWLKGPHVSARIGDPPQTAPGALIDTAGLSGWDDATTTVSIWFHLSHTGKLHLQLESGAPTGSKSTLAIEFMGHSRELDLNNKPLYDIGDWTVTDTGYMSVVIRGIKKSGPYFANIRNLLLSGEAAAAPIAFVPNNEGNFFHWGRRGPSVHFGYPVSGSIEWFYNEVTVPVGQDIIGSYFMADGFGQGYFGMQVNSATERRLLFSVWSPFETDDPKAIPDSLKIQLLAKGEGVHTGAFGNEGSGGQSYLVYPWKAGETYKFLIRAVPNDVNEGAGAGSAAAGTAPGSGAAGNAGASAAGGASGAVGGASGAAGGASGAAGGA